MTQLVADKRLSTNRLPSNFRHLNATLQPPNSTAIAQFRAYFCDAHTALTFALRGGL